MEERHPDKYLREKLSPEQYSVLRDKGTEPAFSGEYVDKKDDGIYICAGCGAELFSSDTKFDSGTGWPSFADPMTEDAVELKEDTGHGMHRTEVVCKKCGGHLGHLFKDGPQEKGGKRFCINSCSLDFQSNTKEK